MASRASIRLGALPKATIRSSSSKSPTTKTVKLECERKFTPVNASREVGGRLARKASPEVIIHDKYFDYQNLMKKQGIYVRLRSKYTPSTSDSKTQWEAKVRLGGDFVNSQFEEFVGQVEVVKAVQKHHSEFSMEVLRKLPVKVDMTTHREVFSVPSFCLPVGAKGKIVIDTCSFNHYPSSLSKDSDSTHVVGEVELTKDVCFADGVEKSEIEIGKKQEVAALSEALDDYMSPRFDLFARDQTPIGKLTAYFLWKSKIEEKEKAAAQKTIDTTQDTVKSVKNRSELLASSGIVLKDEPKG